MDVRDAYIKEFNVPDCPPGPESEDTPLCVGKPNLSPVGPHPIGQWFSFVPKVFPPPPNLWREALRFII